MNDLDSVIIEQYLRFDTPADAIVADPALASAFAKEVNAASGAEPPSSIASVSKRLLNLRRKGEEKGGLPRLRRRYCGRGDNASDTYAM